MVGKTEIERVFPRSFQTSMSKESLTGLTRRVPKIKCITRDGMAITALLESEAGKTVFHTPESSLFDLHSLAC